MKNYKKLIDLVVCLYCKGNLILETNSINCTKCKKNYPIVDGIPRFVDESYYELNEDNTELQKKTKNYFGFEWEYFNQWGFLEDGKTNIGKEHLNKGGTVSDRIQTFDNKCRLDRYDINSKIVLDAGCGNGRYTYEAALRSSEDSLIIGVDVGYGAVKSAYENTKDLDSVIIIQASLFDLPFKDEIIDSCFSNGVLMHTGNAQKAFAEISRKIKTGGVFVAHVYGKLNPIWEFNDYWIRKITTKLSIRKGLKLAQFFSKIAKIINVIPKGLVILNLFIRLQPTEHHMFDWYSAPVASHHTYDELSAWFYENNFNLIDDISLKNKTTNKLIFKPWAINLKGKKK